MTAHKAVGVVTVPKAKCIMCFHCHPTQCAVLCVAHARDLKFLQISRRRAWQRSASSVRRICLTPFSTPATPSAEVGWAHQVTGFFFSFGLISVGMFHLQCYKITDEYCMALFLLCTRQGFLAAAQSLHCLLSLLKRQKVSFDSVALRTFIISLYFHH